MKKRGGLGRVGSGRVQIDTDRVRRTLFFTRWTQASLFFRSAVTIAPFTVHLVLPAERLEQAMLSINKLSKKNTEMQNAGDYYRFFFESVGEQLITKEELRVRQNKCNHL